MKQELKLRTTTTPHHSQNLTTPEAAEYLRVRPGTLEIWRWNGKGPVFLKLGRAVRYRLGDLEDFQNKAVRNSTTCEV